MRDVPTSAGPASRRADVIVPGSQGSGRLLRRTFVIAFVLVKQGQAKIKAAGPPVPEQTIETVKEDVEWAKTQMRSDRT